MHTYKHRHRHTDACTLTRALTPVLSDATDADAWSGRTGLVHHAVLQDHPNLSAMQVYACGAPVMVEAARRDFVAQAHLSEAQFYADSFLSAADQASCAP